MGSGDNSTSDISEWRHITTVNMANRFGNKVNYLRQMLKNNDRCTGIDYIRKTLLHLVLEGWYDVDSATAYNLLSATDTQRSTPRAHLLHLQTIQDEPIIRPVSPQVYYLREMHVHGLCRSIKSISLRDASEDFAIPNFGQLCHMQI
jgi:hypothetical protein